MASVEVSSSVVTVPKLTGLLKEIEVDLVDFVQEGTLFAVFEEDEFRHQVTQAEAQSNLTNTRILAPQSGYVDKCRVEPATLFSPSTPLLTLVKVDPAKVVLNLPQRDLDLAVVGHAAEIRVAGSSTRHQGTILQVAPTIEVASQFENLHQPLIIMCAVPFAMIGVVLTLIWTDTTLNIQSILGTTLLAGIAVNNAIILVDYINLLRQEYGMPLYEAVEEGGRRRLRPILMTTATTVLALIPLSLGLGTGGEVQAPMARVVIGGMFTSTLITLVFVPVLYTLVEEGLERLRSREHAQKKEATERSGDPSAA